METLFKNKSAVILAIIWLVVIVAVGSSTITMLLIDNNQQSGESDLWASTEDAEKARVFYRLSEIYDILEEESYWPLDSNKLMLGAAYGMTAAVGDPFTLYFTPEDMELLDADTNGVYYGLGATVLLNTESGLLLQEVFSNSPAEAAGLLAGDNIIAINGTYFADDPTLTQNDIVNMLMCEEGAQLLLTVVRQDQQLDILFTCGRVELDYATHTILDGDIGYINIDRFSGNAIPCLEQAIKQLQKANVKALIVDVRDNPGGLLDHVLLAADLFLPKCLVVYTEDGQGVKNTFYSDEDYWDIPMAVLTDKGSASASEIFAAAIQENDRGVIIGENTYGKGLIQTLFTLHTDGAGLQVTIAAYFTPNGNSIHGVGVEPDIIIQNTSLETDAQLEAAIAELRKNIAQ